MPEREVWIDGIDQITDATEADYKVFKVLRDRFIRAEVETRETLLNMAAERAAKERECKT